jgi:predicted cupin superfamily sugar epimerase
MELDAIVKSLGLERHPEGGWFRETYRARGILPREALGSGFAGARAQSTAIYYLLSYGERSRLHRIASDEVWHFYLGDPLTVHVIDARGERRDLLLGSGLGAGQNLQGVVEAGAWFGARHIEKGAFGFSLVGCTVAPGFDFDDFELADGEVLKARYPAHRALIEALT